MKKINLKTYKNKNLKEMISEDIFAGIPFSSNTELEYSGEKTSTQRYLDF